MVTGAMTGIGREITIQLIENGYSVAASFAEGVESESDAKLFSESFDGACSCHPLHLGNPISVKSFFESALKQWGNIDSLVNNAAVGSATVANYSADKEAQNHLLLSINAGGTLQLTLLFIDQLKKRWNEMADATASKLINLSSVGGGIAAFPEFNLADGMSKAAIAFMTRQLAAAHVHTPLDVYAICPGATNTQMFQASTLIKMNENEQTNFIKALPKSKLIEPREVADLVLFLMSEKSRLLHGAILDASMGLGSRPGLMTEKR